ncbi:MAG TPA: GDSL-type esterase/lipase family protein [Nitrospiria bacterium]|nr:GDSL-type esterase/lipase family protein [Nitrospiria bacterium]
MATLCIVAFGDSLTTGYQSVTPANPKGEATPYGRFLQELLGNAAKIAVRGINGEMTGEMLLRLERDVVELRPDYAVILGGANDLGWGVPPDEIAQNLVAMYKRLQGRGIRPVAVTVPSIRGFDTLIPHRRTLNELIVNYCRMEFQPFIDLFATTAEPGTLRLAVRYSNDGLHLTTEGYRLIAEKLYKEVFKPLLPWKPA